MEKNKATVIQISSLFLIQWLSIIVIILNASALNASKDSNQGLILASEAGTQDYILLIMAASSLFAVSLLLCLYLQLFLRLLGNKPISAPSKKVLYLEIIFAAIIIALWMAATVIVHSFFNESSPCRSVANISTLSNKVTFDIDKNRLSSTACSLIDATIVVVFTYHFVAFVTIGVWFIALFISVYSLLSTSSYTLNTNAPVHPYENVKIQINRFSIASSIKPHQRDPVQHIENSNHLHYSTITAITTKNNSDIVIVVPSPNTTIMNNKVTIDPQLYTKDNKNNNKEIVPTPQFIVNSNNDPLPSLQQQRSHNNMQKTTTTNNQPQEPKPVILANKQHDWKFDFDFEPIHIDLMLPNANDLINESGSNKYCYQ